MGFLSKPVKVEEENKDSTTNFAFALISPDHEYNVGRLNYLKESIDYEKGFYVIKLILDKYTVIPSDSYNYYICVIKTPFHIEDSNYDCITPFVKIIKSMDFVLSVRNMFIPRFPITLVKVTFQSNPEKIDIKYYMKDIMEYNDESYIQEPICQTKLPGSLSEFLCNNQWWIKLISSRQTVKLWSYLNLIDKMNQEIVAENKVDQFTINCDKLMKMVEQKLTERKKIIKSCPYGSLSQFLTENNFYLNIKGDWKKAGLSTKLYIYLTKLYRYEHNQMHLPEYIDNIGDLKLGIINIHHPQNIHSVSTLRNYNIATNLNDRFYVIKTQPYSKSVIVPHDAPLSSYYICLYQDTIIPEFDSSYDILSPFVKILRVLSYNVTLKDNKRQISINRVIIKSDGLQTLFSYNITDGNEKGEFAITSSHSVYGTESVDYIYKFNSNMNGTLAHFIMKNMPLFKERSLTLNHVVPSIKENVKVGQIVTNIDDGDKIVLPVTLIDNVKEDETPIIITPNDDPDIYQGTPESSILPALSLVTEEQVNGQCEEKKEQERIDWGIGFIVLNKDMSYMCSIDDSLFKYELNKTNIIDNYIPHSRFSYGAKNTVILSMTIINKYYINDRYRYFLVQYNKDNCYIDIPHNVVQSSHVKLLKELTLDQINSIDQIKVCKTKDIWINRNPGCILFDKKLRVIDYLVYINETEGFSGKNSYSIHKEIDENDKCVYDRYITISCVRYHHDNGKNDAEIITLDNGTIISTRYYFSTMYKCVKLNPNGTKNNIVNYLYTNEFCRLGNIVKEYDDGQITKVTEYLFVQCNGCVKIREEEYATIPDSDIRYVNKSTTFYDNGKVKSVTHYIWSSQLNERVIHDPDNCPDTFGYIEYYESGNLKKEIKYCYGKIHSSDNSEFPYAEYFDDDEAELIYIIKNYVCGVLHDHCKHNAAVQIYNINGKIIKNQYYQCGQFISEETLDQN